MDREKTVGADIQVLLQGMRGMTFERMLYQEKPTDRKNRMRALAPGMQTRRYPSSPGRPAGRPGLNVGGNPRTTSPLPQLELRLQWLTVGVIAQRRRQAAAVDEE